MVGSLAVGQGAAGGIGTDTQGGAQHDTISHEGVSIQDMLTGHEAGVKAFPAETEALGNEPIYVALRELTLRSPAVAPASAPAVGT